MQGPRVKSVADVGAALLEFHYAIIRMPSTALEASNSVFSAGPAFFEQHNTQKELAASHGIQEGYREFGAERDARTDRPDLSESFKVWFRNRGDPSVKRWSELCDLHGRIQNALLPFVEIVEGSIKSLADAMGVTADIPIMDFRHESYLQVNYSRPARETRSTITDVHEDGHLLTLVRPTHSGLSICPGELYEPPSIKSPGGRFEPVGDVEPLQLRHDELVIFGSSPTFFLTGGRIKPLFHGVRTSEAAVRQSLIMFANPRRNGPIHPWLQTRRHGDVDVQSVIDAVNYAHLDRHSWSDVRPA